MEKASMVCKQGMFRQFILVVVLLAVTTTAASQEYEFPIAKPGCEERCGNTKIPYPFGLTEGCYYSPHFSMFCNENSDPPTAILTSSAKELTEISLDGKAYTKAKIVRDCYDKLGRVNGSRPVFAGYVGSKFTISNTDNVVVAIGCDTQFEVQASVDNTLEGWYKLGCTSTCFNSSPVASSCPGIGCCQTPLPEGAREYTLDLKSFTNHSNILDFNPCSYAFVMEKAKFNYSFKNLRTLDLVDELPMIIEWAAGDGNCTNKTASVCGENTSCSDAGYSGYRCNCLHGYRGNPYLSHGCQDIDECKEPELNDCANICINTPGNYICSCPKGYHGDGLKNKQGCIADGDGNQQLLVKIMAGVFAFLIILVISSGWLHVQHKKRKLIKRRQKYFEENGGLMLQQRLSGRGGSNEAAKIYSAEDLNKATNNFDENNIVGKGGYGIVYKGIFPPNKIVAIKKSKIVDKDQIEQFINEVIVLSQINHRNVVKLLGCCLETEVPLLVYEFITNGTLFSYIHDETKASTFSWDMRLRIAAETAGVLGYLHSEASIPIIHRDVKSNNVLLDDNLTAKVSDFGASRLAPLDETGILTVVQGTLGYLDPEYFLTSTLTEKSDVFSFGVLMVELITGKNVFSNERPEEERSLAMHFLYALEEGRLFQIVEDCVVKEGNREQVCEIGKLVRRCLSVKGEERPTMKEVAMELEGFRMMGKGKHPWMNVKVIDSEETESFLLPKPKDDDNHFGLRQDHSFKNQVVIPINTGERYTS